MKASAADLAALESALAHGPEPIPEPPASRCVAHLAPMTLVVCTQGRPEGVKIGVRFSNHCFTVKWEEELHQGEEVLLDAGRKPRAFCPVRYQHSLALPAFIEHMVGGHVHQTPEANYVRITTNDGDEYRIFFNVKRSGKGDGHDLELFVESAYCPEDEAISAARMTKVRFVVLVDKTLKGEKVKPFRR